MKTFHCPPFQRVRHRAFTLVELLLSIVILFVLIVVLSETLQQVQSTITRAQSQVEEFEDARQGFESMTRKLSQATLNSYWGYIYRDTTSPNPDPAYYGRQSDLHYAADQLSIILPEAKGNGHGVFFQAHLGESDPAHNIGSQLTHMHDLLNCWGYYVDYVSDLDSRPDFLKTSEAQIITPERKRFRLMEFRLPAEQSLLFSSQLNLNEQKNRAQMYRWFRGPFADTKTTKDYAHPIADNIIAAIISPYLYVTSSNAAGVSTTDMRKKGSYEFDSRKAQWSTSTVIDVKVTKHQMPALLEVTLIAVSERSYDELEQKYGVEGAAQKIREVFRGLLTNPTLFSKDLNNNVNASANTNFEINTIEHRLNTLGIHYKILSTTFPLRASKWITEVEI